ncbi:hypothetical protein BKA66DRAFT_569276 [Pyrenochaeta sp. MPI-SDFR-AT-0127]|nr:hypothetical protein BKA66DRAFT_569276 [Pyrenochaeta sp. MPI-SDFR-AT-0127]
MSRTAKLWRKGHRDARNDMRRNWPVLLLVGFWFGGLCLSAIVVSFIPMIRLSLNHSNTACQPDGSFQLQGRQDFSYWSSSGLFQITLGFGELSFTQAKAIDIIWDVVFGRGGQTLLAFISWRVFATYVTSSMEIMPITFDTYRIIFLQNDSLISGIPCMIRDFTSRLRLRSRSAMIFIIATSLYILTFPTLGSAMTGYSANVRSYIPDRDGNYVPFEKFRMTSYIINDGSRVNKTDGFHVKHLQNGDPLPGFAVSVYQIKDMCHLEWYFSHEDRGYCNMIWGVSTYVENYGFNGGENKSSAFMDITLEPPLLNVTPVYLPGWLWGPNSTSHVYDAQPKLNADQSKIVWIWSNQTFDKHYIEDNGRCQATDILSIHPIILGNSQLTSETQTYQWGFSFIQLILMMIFLLMWSIGITTMWAQSRRTIRKVGRRGVAGNNKAIFELAHTMHQELVNLGSTQAKAMSTNPDLDHNVTPQIPKSGSVTPLISDSSQFASQRSSLLSLSALNESELCRCIGKDLRGGSISYQAYLSPEDAGRDGKTSPRSNFRASQKTAYAWIKKEELWLGANLISLIIGGVTVYGILVCPYALVAWIYPMGAGLSFAVPFAFLVGSSCEGRIILLLWSYVLIGIVPSTVMTATL